MHLPELNSMNYAVVVHVIHALPSPELNWTELNFELWWNSSASIYRVLFQARRGPPQLTDCACMGPA